MFKFANIKLKKERFGLLNLLFDIFGSLALLGLLIFCMSFFFYPEQHTSVDVFKLTLLVFINWLFTINLVLLLLKQ